MALARVSPLLSGSEAQSASATPAAPPAHLSSPALSCSNSPHYPGPIYLSKQNDHKPVQPVLLFVFLNKLSEETQNLKHPCISFLPVLW